VPRRRRRPWPWLLLLLLVGFWFGHEKALVWGTRKAITYLEPRLGIKLDIGSMRLHLFQPIEVRDFRLRVTNPKASTTDVTARRISLASGSLWNAFFGDARIFRSLVVEKLDGTFDFRRPALIILPLPSYTRPQKEQLAAFILRFLPKQVRVISSNPVFLADGQSYTVRGLDADFDEMASGRFSVKSALIEAGTIRQEILNGSAITAWKDGAMYLSDLQVREGIVLRDFVANYVNIGGISLDWDLGVHGGTVRGNIVFGEEDHELRLEAAMSIVNLPVGPLPGLLAIPARADGLIRDARLTFRGNPDRTLDNEISLRVSADNFRWNERGWQSLSAGVNYIGRRLYVTAFDLTQADNRISASGELAVPERMEDLPRAQYSAGLSADVRDLGALAALAGPPFDKLAGQLYVHAAVRSENGNLHGYLNGEASGIAYQTLPPASARISIVAQNDELQVAYAELWAANDRIEANGTFSLASPHRYGGKINGRIADLGIYTPFGGEAVAKNVFTGAAVIDWQGDGTMTAHSGAFDVRLTDVMTSVTPTGLTGEFAGTYSPQNIYLNTVRLTHGPLDLRSQLTVSSSGVNITGLTLKRGRLDLLRGDGFVPLDLFALSGGKTVAQALAIDKPVYANFTSGDLRVADLALMAGQKASFGGTLRLNLGATGAMPQLRLTGGLTARDISATVEDFTLPPTTADLQLDTGDRSLVAKGSIVTRGFKPLSLTASMPFAYEVMPDGGVRLVHADAPIQAEIAFPRTSLEIFRPFVPSARRLEGTLAGRLAIDGRLNAPNVRGEATLTGGDIELSADMPRINALSGRLVMEASRVRLDGVRGEVGAGPFQLTGGADFSDPRNPAIDVRLTGSRVLLARDTGLRLRADLDLTARGKGAAGSVTGSVRLVDGRIFRKLEVTPLIVRSPVSGPIFVAPSFAGLVPEPWASWKLDASIRNGDPFLLMGNLATGEISPDLWLRGTLGLPYAEGVIVLNNLQANLPASTLLIPDGRIYFTKQYPFMPVMDVRARSEVSGYTIQMYAYGPLVESNLALRSDPPLSQENLIFLLTTGLTPAGMSGAGLGEAAAGQGGIILLRSIARQVEPLGVDLNDFVNRLSVRIVPPKDTSQSSSLISELRVTDRFALTTGRDGFGFYNAGVQYTVRLR
jgi:TamB, inner membrane protein subunit of TAM complex